LPQLLNILENEFKEAYLEVVQNPRIDKIEKLGDSLFELGENENLNFLMLYGQELKASSETFDIEKMRTILNIYPKLIEKCKTLISYGNDK